MLSVSQLAQFHLQLKHPAETQKASYMQVQYTYAGELMRVSYRSRAREHWRLHLRFDF